MKNNKKPIEIFSDIYCLNKTMTQPKGDVSYTVVQQYIDGLYNENKSVLETMIMSYSKPITLYNIGELTYEEQADFVDEFGECGNAILMYFLALFREDFTKNTNLLTSGNSVNIPFQSPLYILICVNHLIDKVTNISDDEFNKIKRFIKELYADNEHIIEQSIASNHIRYELKTLEKLDDKYKAEFVKEYGIRGAEIMDYFMNLIMDKPKFSIDNHNQQVRALNALNIMVNNSALQPLYDKYDDTLKEHLIDLYHKVSHMINVDKTNIIGEYDDSLSYVQQRLLRNKECFIEFFNLNKWLTDEDESYFTKLIDRVLKMIIDNTYDEITHNIINVNMIEKAYDNAFDSTKIKVKSSVLNSIRIKLIHLQRFFESSDKMFDTFIDKFGDDINQFADVNGDVINIPYHVLTYLNQTNNSLDIKYEMTNNYIDISGEIKPKISIDFIDEIGDYIDGLSNIEVIEKTHTSKTKYIKFNYKDDNIIITISTTDKPDIFNVNKVLWLFGSHFNLINMYINYDKIDQLFDENYVHSLYNIRGLAIDKYRKLVSDYNDREIINIIK